MSSILASSSNKPIITTAPSQSPALTLPPLKQKTAIVKSKIPPPVPPRGSPKDRRTKKSDCSSPKGTPSSAGRYNYLNDKYFACTLNNSTTTTVGDVAIANKCNNNRAVSAISPSDQPRFGEKRSPNCVKDWLEINDFHIPLTNDLNTNILPGPKSNGKTQSSIRVKSMVEHFSHQNLANESFPVVRLPKSKQNLPAAAEKNDSKYIPIQNRKTNSIYNASVRNEIDDLKRKGHVSQLLLSSDNISSLYSDSNQNGSEQINVKSVAAASATIDGGHILNTLKPNRVRRKKRIAPRIVENVNSKAREKCEIIQAMSNVELRFTDENYNRILDNFSLEGEFV